MESDERTCGKDSCMTPYLFLRENGTETGPDLLQESLLDEKGTVEAGLVIIPLTLLFLMILQILFAGSWQVMERAKLHDLVVRSSLSEATREGSSGDSKNNSYFGEYGGQKVGSNANGSGPNGSGPNGSGPNGSGPNGSNANGDIEFADLYLLEKFYFLSGKSFSSSSKVSSTQKSSAYGDIHKIEVNTQIPIFHGILKFFGVEGVGIRNTAVLIEN
jgi:hypothetical protein